MEALVARQTQELENAEARRKTLFDRVTRREVEIGNNSTIIHELLGTCEHWREVASLANALAKSLGETNSELETELEGFSSREELVLANSRLRDRLEEYRHDLGSLATSYRHLVVANPTSALNEVLRRAEFLIQEIHASLHLGRSNSDHYMHAERVAERLRLHFRECVFRVDQALNIMLIAASPHRDRVLSLVRRYSHDNPDALLTLGQHAGLLPVSTPHSERPIYEYLPFSTHHPLGDPTTTLPSSVPVAPLLSLIRSETRRITLQQLEAYQNENDVFEREAARIMGVEAELAEAHLATTAISPSSPEPPLRSSLPAA